MKRQFRAHRPGRRAGDPARRGRARGGRVQREALGEGGEQLGELGVTVREGARATAIDARGVTIEIDGATSGSTPERSSGPPASTRSRSPAPSPRATGASTDRGGRIEVNPDLTVRRPSRDLGDRRRRLPEGPGGKPLPGLATVAIQQAHHVAKGIAEGRPGASTPFSYFDKGALAVVGKGQGGVRDQRAASCGAGPPSSPTSAFTSTTSAARPAVASRCSSSGSGLASASARAR